MPVPAGVPTNGLQFCFDASQTNGTDAASVPSLLDQSPNAWHAAQGTAAAQGIYRAAGIGGKGAVEFDMVDDTYPLPAAALGVLRNIGGGTLCAVVKDTKALNATTGRRLVFVSRGGSVAAGRLALSHAEHLTTSGGAMTGNTAARRLDADTVQNITGKNTTNDPVFQMSMVDWANAAGWHITDGTVDVHDTTFLTAGLTENTASSAANIGSNGTPAAFFGGLIAFVCIWNRVLTEAERTDLGKFVQDTYGILQANYPYTFTHARPVSDVTATGWTPTPLWDKIDEDPVSDADFVEAAGV